MGVDSACRGGDGLHVLAVAVAGEAIAQLQGAARLGLERKFQRGIRVQAVGDIVRGAGTGTAALSHAGDTNAQRAGVVEAVALEAKRDFAFCRHHVDQGPPDQADTHVRL
ncbi:hypothetical protein G6F22_014083 [Rhizopus arrhizus]|nr:hypothetical protein G6F22_014083 [Rhizopus arrhizus]KAG0915462.1 hypothetical protein G6F32_016554 [Rhizopus arrhizus]